VYDIAERRTDATFELVDLRDFDLPLLKAAGFVGYGGAGGACAIEQLRLVMGELHVADVRSQVLLSLFTDFEAFTTFKPAAFREADLQRVLNEVVSWSSALKPLRATGDGQ